MNTGEGGLGPLLWAQQSRTTVEKAQTNVRKISAQSPVGDTRTYLAEVKTAARMVLPLPIPPLRIAMVELDKRRGPTWIGLLVLQWRK